MHVLKINSEPILKKHRLELWIWRQISGCLSLLVEHFGHWERVHVSVWFKLEQCLGGWGQGVWDWLINYKCILVGA